MGASDLARYNYSFDDMPAGQTDPNLTHFSIAHDLADILPLTKQAQQLNPSLKLMAYPWSAPGWMKSDGSFVNHSWLQSQYYAGLRPVLRQVPSRPTRRRACTSTTRRRRTSRAAATARATRR